MKIVSWNITKFSLSRIVQDEIIKKIRNPEFEQQNLNYRFVSNVRDAGRFGPWKTINLGGLRTPKILLIAEIAGGGDIAQTTERPSDIFVLIEPQQGTTERGLAAVKILTSVMPEGWAYIYKEVSTSEGIAVLYNSAVVQPEDSSTFAVGDGWRDALQVNFNVIPPNPGPPFTLVAVHSPENAAVLYAGSLFGELADRLSETPPNKPPMHTPLIVCGDFNCGPIDLRTAVVAAISGLNLRVDVGVLEATTAARTGENSCDHFVTISHGDPPETTRIDLLAQVVQRLTNAPLNLSDELARRRYVLWFAGGEEQHAHLPISWEDSVAAPAGG